MLFDIGSFMGEVPRVSKKLLPNQYARSAVNCDLRGGNLTPEKGCSLVQSLSGDTVTVFKQGSAWRQWPSVVDVVRSFVNDNNNRIIITGDSYPKETDSSLYPSTRRLGIPEPTVALVITLGGTAVTEGTTVSDFEEFDPTASYNIGDQRANHGAVYSCLVVIVDGQVETTEGEWEDSNSPSTSTNWEINEDIPEEIVPDIERTISYVYTIVGVWDDGSVTESAPSLPTAVIDVYEGQTVTLTGFATSAATGVYATRFRIYRLTSGTYGAEYQYVDEIALTNTSYTDSVSDEELGEILATEGWTAPDENLTGIISTSSGINVGFVKNKIYPSETFVGYAYPSTYSLTTESDIVGLGFIGSSVVVLTKTKPYILIGQNPESLSIEKIPYDQACVSKRSIVSFPGGVAYACPDGLAVMDASGLLVILTEKLFTKKQWAALGPQNIIGFWHDNAYYAFFNGESTYIRIDLAASEVSRGGLPGGVYGGYYVASDDILYLIIGTASTKNLYSFRTGELTSMTWISGTRTLENRVPIAGRVLGDFTEGSSVITMTADGEELFSKTITSNDMFRFTPQRIEEAFLTVTGTGTIDRILIGETGQEVLDV